MTEFQTRYKKLNPAQRQAVEAINGPLLVIAGPGTGKTELLSMRAANILKKTDTLPENILCLTFTDSGANAMRERLADIIGPDAYKVAIHTFHSFGTEIINQNGEFFYRGAEFKPADEISTFEILHGIFDELEHSSPLASQLNGEYTYLKDAARAISELKQAGLSHDELLNILAANEEVLDTIEAELAAIFAGKISLSMLEKLAPLAEAVARLPRPNLSPAITPLANILALSMAHAFDEALSSGKTNAITRWRNEWLEKNQSGTFVFKDRKRIAKLRALSHVYFSYLSRLERAGLYDYDDMILSVVQTMENTPDLLYNLREKYQYVMVDEFQDTNLAQLRIVFDLMDPDAHDGSPNVMAVGDDDQAIYSFQGADVNNIHRFRERYPEHQLVTLIDNYRSDANILTVARETIVQGEDRLEATIEMLDKKLIPHHAPKKTEVKLVEHVTANDERAWIADDIAKQIAHGEAPASITVIARKHAELIELLPYLEKRDIAVNYERRDNVLELESFLSIELVAQIVQALNDGDHTLANSLMPQLLAHPAFAYRPEDIWRLSLRSYRNREVWFEQMVASEIFSPLAAWLIEQSAISGDIPLELMLDNLIGTPRDIVEPESVLYRSPLYDYYFGDIAREENAEKYLVNLDALRTVRAKLREYRPHEQLRLRDFVEFINLHRDMNMPITSIRSRAESTSHAINLMTAHKSKGLEFKTVYVIGAVDSTWGERVRVRSRLIGYPANLQIAPAGDTSSERLRLFYVAMTRARDRLVVSYSSLGENGKELLAASFLTGLTLQPVQVPARTDFADILENARIDWLGHLVNVPKKSMKTLLEPLLESYKLSATHLTTFLDVSRGGPSQFLIQSLLHFPAAKSASASYGTAIHHTLQRAHNHYAATGNRRPVEDILGDFTTELKSQTLTDIEFEALNRRGIAALTRFLDARYGSFATSQRTEVSFASQGVVIGKARLTGSLDLIDHDKTSLVVTDYKTGSASRTWTGKSDYDKIKLHRYKQQLMFYQLLIENSRDYSKLHFEKGVLQFVEPDSDGEIVALDATFTDEELVQFRQLIEAVWHHIMTLDFPDISDYPPSYKGILAFEQDVIDKTL